MRTSAGLIGQSCTRSWQPLGLDTVPRRHHTHSEPWNWANAKWPGTLAVQTTPHNTLPSAIGDILRAAHT